MDAKTTGHPEVDRWLREAIALIDQREYTQALGPLGLGYNWFDQQVGSVSRTANQRVNNLNKFVKGMLAK